MLLKFLWFEFPRFCLQISFNRVVAMVRNNWNWVHVDAPLTFVSVQIGEGAVRFLRDVLGCILYCVCELRLGEFVFITWHLLYHV